MAVARLSITKTARRALPEVCLARPRSARQRFARASPRRKQKYDRYPQPTPFSQGSCVLVCQEIPATNIVLARPVGLLI
ncbi:hypothetical protein ACFX2B_012808 [Malus domestica]